MSHSALVVSFRRVKAPFWPWLGFILIPHGHLWVREKMAWRSKEMNSKRCLDRSIETKRTGSVRFTVVSQIVLRGALLECGDNEEREVSSSELSFIPRGQNSFPTRHFKWIHFDSVGALLGLIVPTCLRPEEINPIWKIERDRGSTYVGSGCLEKSVCTIIWIVEQMPGTKMLLFLVDSSFDYR